MFKITFKQSQSDKQLTISIKGYKSAKKNYKSLVKQGCAKARLEDNKFEVLFEHNRPLV